MNKLLKENWNEENFGEEFAGGDTELLGRVFEIEENDDDELADQEEAMRFAAGFVLRGQRLA
ncbi:MAG: hypothetical protein K0R53_297 [Burkholderiales bacterium]|nr:hypothetical protein [Burkholderiales bacterium]